MKIKYEVKDILTVPQGYYLATSIPASFAMGGVARQIDNVFNAKEKLRSKYPLYDVLHGMYNEESFCLIVDNVMFLVDKLRARDTVNMDWLEYAFEDMRSKIIDNRISKVAIPKIGSGADNIKWSDVRDIIVKVFEGVDVEFLVCVLDSSQLEDDYDEDYDDLDDFDDLSEEFDDYKYFEDEDTDEDTDIDSLVADDLENDTDFEIKSETLSADVEPEEFRKLCYKAYTRQGYSVSEAFDKSANLATAYAKAYNANRKKPEPDDDDDEFLNAVVNNMKQAKENNNFANMVNNFIK